MTRTLGRWALLGIGMFVFAWCSTAFGERFILESGGQIVGEILNPEQSPRETYLIKTDSGAQITLDKSQVKKIEYQRPDEVEYDKIRSRYPDTVEGQWALAEWCRENRLSVQRETHLKRILELNPDHEQARRTLGYSQIDGQWMTQEEWMTKQGYRRYKGRWMLPQEIELVERDRKNELAEKEWAKKVNTWRDWLGTDKAQLARENLLAIDDPQAIKALASALQDDPRDRARLYYVEALAHIGTPEAMDVLAARTLEDPVEEVCLSCLDRLKEKKNPRAVNYFIGKLKSKDNAMVNRAAVALKHMGDPAAIGPLVDALVTVHKFKVVSGSGGGGGGGGDQYSATFGNNGVSGFGFGGGPKVISKSLNNRAVLEALVELSGGVNYGFNVQTWKAWYLQQKKRTGVNTRRD